MTVHYRNTAAPATPFPDLENITVDNTIVAMPFPRLRLVKLPPFTSLLSRAIARLGYSGSCKVALHYKTRFWESLLDPIIGGCGSTDIPAIGSVCYPSYAINSSGPGVLLASYISGDLARSVGTWTAEEHAAYVQRAMIDIHGDVAEEEYTGLFDRICWEQVAGGAWSEPKVGQQELYLPAYFKTEMGTVVVGEHTSYTHAWIFSALESAVRGSTQLMLDLGLVDEAKAITEKWMARWISI
jgi:monoamine oxidase